MSKESVDKLFETLYRLTDMRQIFRETSPTHDLNEEQKEEVHKIVEESKKNLDDIEGEFSDD